MPNATPSSADSPGYRSPASRRLVGLRTVPSQRACSVRLIHEVDRKWAQDHLDDIRVINTDHFIIFRHPEVVSQLVLEALSRTLEVPDRG